MTVHSLNTWGDVVERTIGKCRGKKTVRSFVHMATLICGVFTLLTVPHADSCHYSAIFGCIFVE